MSGTKFPPAKRFRARSYWRSARGLVAGCLATSAAASPAAAQTVATPAKAASAASTVDTVTVTAHKAAAQTLIDRKVYRTATDLQSTTGSAADILDQLPSVDVDADGNVSLRGDPSVTILVDGKPSAQFSGPTRGLSLQQFSARDIDRVEVMTSPPARFKAEGSGGVINIVTRRRRTAGLSGGGQASVGEDGRFVAGANLAYNVGRLSLSGGVTLRQDVKERQVTDARTAADPATGAPVLSREALDERLRRLIPLVKLAGEYRFNDRQSLSVDYSHRELSGHRVFDQHDESRAAVPGPLTSLSDRHSDGHEWAVDADASVRFEQKLTHPEETLSLALQRSVSREREHYAYDNLFTLPAVATSRDRLGLSNDILKTEFSADYHLPLSHARDLKLGYDLEADDNAFDNTGLTVDPISGALLDNPSVTSHFRYRQQVNALYEEAEAPWGKWTVQGGLRLEQTDVRFHEITGDAVGTQSYLGAYPSLHLDRGLPGDATLSLSVSRRIARPDPEALNPFLDTQDIHNLRAGNANLLPQDTWAYELGYSAAISGSNYGVTGYYRDISNSVTNVLRVVSADVVLSTLANLPHNRAAGLEFTANGKVTGRLSYSLSGDLFYSEIDASAFGSGGLKSTTGLNGKASLDWRPIDADTAQVSLSRTDRRLTPQGYVDAIDLVNLGYKHQISPGLSFTATVTDLFDGQRFRRVVASPTLRDTYERHQLGRVALIGLVYSFGARGKKARGFEYDQ